MKTPTQRSPLKTIRRNFFTALAAAIHRLDGHNSDGKLESDWMETTRLELRLPRLALPFDGYRLVHFSDIHIGTWINRPRLETLVERINREEPDLIAITGDFVTFEPEQFAADLVSVFGSLQARDGVVAVLGNHDHWTSPQAIRQILRDSSIIELNNKVHTLERDTARLHLAGVDDVVEEQARLEVVLERLPESGAAILLAHEPDFAEVSAASGRFDLQLSGHSHGGQLILPLIGPPMLPRLARKYPLGLYQVEDMLQYTTRGVGTTYIQLRINCRPEIAVITLRAGRSHQLS